MLQYNITLRLLEFNGVYDDAETGTSSANWTSVGEFQLNPSKPLGRSPNGRVRSHLLYNYMTHFYLITLLYAGHC